MQEQKEKKIPEQLEEEIAKEALPLIQFVMSHSKKIVTMIGAIVIVAASYSGYKLYTQHSIKKAQKELNAILSKETTSQKIQGLNRLLKTAPSKIKQGIRLELAKLYKDAKDYKNSLHMWEELKKNSDDENIKIVATIGEAECYHLMGNSINALKILSKIKDNKEYMETVTMEIAKLAEEAGNLRQALWAYKKLLSTLPPNDPTRMFYRYKIAEIENKMEKNA